MFVSIILCTYNRVKLLPRAINSVIKQSYPDWELIVVDDGSKDRTQLLVKRYSEKDKRISYTYQPNAGLAAARNTGIQRSSGEFICFLDSDDELAPLHIEKRIQYLEKNKKIDFLHGGVRFIGSRVKQYVIDLTNPKKKIHLSKCHIGGTFFFRKEVLKKVNQFKPIPFGEDFDFYKNVQKHFTIKKVRYPTYIYHLETENRLCDIYTEEFFLGKKKMIIF